MLKNSKGQSTLEYTLLLGSIIIVFIVYMSGTFRESLTNSLDDVTNSMVEGTEDMAGMFGIE